MHPNQGAAPAALARVFVVALSGVLGMACESAPKGVDTRASMAAERAPTPAHTPVAGDPQAELVRLDKRAPLPLLPLMANHQKENMRDHLLAIQEALLALGREDFDAVSTAAARMGYSEQVAGMCSHMGSGAPGFAERAIEFHRRADSVVAAARERNTSRTLNALGTMMQSCTGCHAAFRQDVVANLPTTP